MTTTPQPIITEIPTNAALEARGATVLTTRSTHGYALVSRDGQFIIGYADYPRSPANQRRASRWSGTWYQIESYGPKTVRRVVVPRGD